MTVDRRPINSHRSSYFYDHGNEEIDKRKDHNGKDNDEKKDNDDEDDNDDRFEIWSMQA